MSAMPTDLPSEQRGYLADGKVSAGEYAAAFGSFQRCVLQGGGRLEVVTRYPGGLIDYRVGGRLGTPQQPVLSSVEGRCYHQFLDSVEYLFQTTDPGALSDIAQQQRQLYADKVYPCLIKNGVSAPPQVDPASAQGKALSKQWLALGQAGKC
jgi:hypothetical protein